MEEGKKNRRFFRSLVIYPAFQLPLLGFNLFIIALSLLVFWVTGHQILSDLQPAGSLSGIEVGFYNKYLQYQTEQFNRTFLIASLVAIVASTLFTLYLSHRMAGPMVRLRAHFRAIRDGVNPIPDLRFRDNDLLSDIPPLVNEAIAALTSRFRAHQRDRA
jgi:hypothetical protein